MSDENKGEFCATLADGSKMTVYYENLGWSERLGGYRTAFMVGSMQIVTLFECARNEQYLCPDPPARLAHDEAELEEHMIAVYGQPIVEMEFEG